MGEGTKVTPGEAIDAAQSAFGKHPGFRALHAKGILCRGRFVASADAATLTTAGHMQGEPVDVTFRFSNGGGNPRVPDYAPDLRGMAVKFYLADGSRADLVLVNTPLFASPTPELFVALLRAQGAGPAAAIRVPWLMARNPVLLKALPRFAGAMRPVASYASVQYWSQHSYKWIDATGAERYVRYAAVPAVDEGRLSPLAARRQGVDYLQDDLRSRLTGGAEVRFSLEVQIATPGDPVNDPSASWPAHRRRVTVGEFSVTGLELERETGGDVLVFDPTRVVAGIECSDDPVLRFRGPAYRESVARRTASP